MGQVSEDAFSPAAFVQALYGDALCDDRRAVVWAKGSGAVWCKTADEVQAVATVRSRTHDVYLGACLQHADAERAGSRGEAATVTCLPGVWADIDICDSGHKSGAYPPTVEAALAQLAARIPQPPTVVVHTGGGVHVWWLLDEPWVLTTDADRREAAALVMRVQARVRAAWSEKGWRLDPTQDLARVMRIPGTFNRKSAAVRPVVAIESEGPRHAPSDLLDGCPPIHAAIANVAAQDTATQTGAGLIIDGSREPPGSKLVDLCECDGRFKLTWHRKRHDLQDQSQSGYDYALMVRALAAGWADQEIVDLCVAHRKRGGQSPKRPDYYTASLARAKASTADAERQTERSEREAETRQAQIAATARLLDTAAAGVTPSPEVHAGVVGDLREALGLPVTGLRRHDVDPPTWDLLLEGPVPVVKLGTAEWALKQASFRLRIVEALDTIPAALKPAQWERIAQLMLRLAVHAEYDEVSEAGGLMDGLVREYLQGHTPSTDIEGAGGMGLPITKGDKVGIRLSHFRGWLDRVEGDRLKRNQVAPMLRRAGWIQDKIHVNGSTTLSYWMRQSAPVAKTVSIGGKKW